MVEVMNKAELKIPGAVGIIKDGIQFFFPELAILICGKVIQNESLNFLVFLLLIVSLIL
jgi:hypothetical protein